MKAGVFSLCGFRFWEKSLKVPTDAEKDCEDGCLSRSLVALSVMAGRMKIKLKYKIAGLLIAVSCALLFLARLNGANEAGMFLSIENQQKISTNVLQVTLVFSNAAPRALRLVDDVDGNPDIVLEGRTNSYRLKNLSNRTNIVLASGASLETEIYLTNPPSTFRLRCTVRDSKKEMRLWYWSFLPEFLQSKYRPDTHVDPPSTDWILFD
jgi:hypothetical protein